MAALIFSNLASDNRERVRRFASLPFHSLLKYSRQQIESRWMDEMAELLAAEGALAIIAEMGATVCGFAICTPLPWESALLGKSMWAIKHIGVDSESMDRNSVATGLVAEINRRLAARDADFLLCKTSASDPAVIHALESSGFLLMDTLLDFVCDCRIVRARKNPPPPLPEGFVLRLATSADVELLVETAHASFAEHFGRFHADPRIGRVSATKVYEAWIRSCANGWADWVFVATHGDRIAGYSAWKKPSVLNARYGLCLGHYNIGAVHPDFSGRGIFTALTRAGMDKLCGSADWIEGPTHIENHAVQRGYLRLGWQIAGTQHSFHKWLKP
jgi:ribosomal protein S18 acetylase RimI-like enzyme